MYTTKIFQVGNEFIETNAGMGNVMNVVETTKIIYDNPCSDDLVNELKEFGFKAKIIKFDKITNW